METMCFVTLYVVGEREIDDLAFKSGNDVNGDFAHWEAVEEYEHHGDQVIENDEVEDKVANTEHIPYVPTDDRVMQAVRDSITEEKR
ncbi:unnamed protein product [Arabidopsis halleri]